MRSTIGCLQPKIALGRMLVVVFFFRVFVEACAENVKVDNLLFFFFFRLPFARAINNLTMIDLLDNKPCEISTKATINGGACINKNQ